MPSSVTAVLVTRGGWTTSTMLRYGCGVLILYLCVGQRDVGQRVMLISQCRDALIRHRNAGQQDVGHREAIRNQSRDALIHTRSVGHKDVGQRVPISDKDCDALIRDRRFGQTGRWTASEKTEARP